MYPSIRRKRVTRWPEIFYRRKKNEEKQSLAGDNRRLYIHEIALPGVDNLWSGFLLDLSRLDSCILEPIVVRRETDVVVGGNADAKIYKIFDNIESITVGRDLGSNTPHVPTYRHHILRLALIHR